MLKLTTWKTPTPDKALCATAPPSSIAHLVLPIRSGWGSRAPRSAPRPRCTPGQVMLQPLCAAQPVERIHRRRDVHASKERSAPDPRLTRGPGGTGTREDPSPTTAASSGRKPNVDDAVSDLDLRRTEYAAAVHATDEAANVYYRAQGEAIASERDRRRADHVQRIEAVLQQARAEQQHAATTNPSVARRLYSSSSENGSPPRPTKRLNLGPPSSGPAIETTGSEQDTGRSGESDDSSSSGNASNPPPLSLNALMPMALLAPQASAVPPSTPASTPTEAQTPDYLFDSESESNSQRAESDGNNDNVESDGNDENAESDGNDESAESDGNDENAESVESSEFVPSSEAEDSENES
ncbi:hypothetical protein PF010_g6913 [Phytophthora fragariae]|uniref:Uncharacterized protein n=2 Tax=Phytophthora fragariae TaxID=53985 RepID=A0A6G0LJH7_9STRA|nr:hypothetical protein PF010_g6913 [Phytophthora fragariae]